MVTDYTFIIILLGLIIIVLEAINEGPTPNKG